MRKLTAPLFLAALLLAPSAARAGWLLEASAGQGWEVSPDTVKQPTNLMLAPGYTVLDFLTLELGVLSSLENARGAKFDVQLRPMAELSLPLFPVYLKAIVGVTGLAASPVKLQYGGALGWRLGLGGVGIFLEAGLLPSNVQAANASGGKSNDLVWIAEGRLGLRLG